MSKKQEQDPLTDKLIRIGYPDATVLPGMDEVLMLHVQGRLISSVDYALSLPDEELKVLIDETVQTTGGH